MQLSSQLHGVCKYLSLHIPAHGRNIEKEMCTLKEFTIGQSLP